jgi:hypothetical protein
LNNLYYTMIRTENQIDRFGTASNFPRIGTRNWRK